MSKKNRGAVDAVILETTENVESTTASNENEEIKTDSHPEDEVVSTEGVNRNTFNSNVWLADHGSDQKVLGGDTYPLLKTLKAWGIAPTTMTVTGKVEEVYIIPNTKVMDLLDAITVVNNRLI